MFVCKHVAFLLVHINRSGQYVLTVFICQLLWFIGLSWLD